MADTLTFMQILDLINQQFPQYVPLLTKPGVFAVLGQMMQDGNSGHPWTAERVSAGLQNTEYFKTTTDAQRQWDALASTNPATAADKATQVKHVFDDLQTQLGITLDTTGGMGSPAFQLFTQAVSQGWSPDRIKYEMLATVNKSPTGGGQLGSDAAQIRAMANDYGVQLSDQAVMTYAQQMGQKAIDANAMKGYLIKQAENTFPGMADALSRGMTVRQIADPYLQMAQQELGINPASVNLTDPKWMAALDQVDPKTGVHYSMTQPEWLSHMRTDPSYGWDYTTQAQTQSAAMATQIATKMGAM